MHIFHIMITEIHRFQDCLDAVICVFHQRKISSEKLPPLYSWTTFVRRPDEPSQTSSLECSEVRRVSAQPTDPFTQCNKEAGSCSRIGLHLDGFVIIIFLPHFWGASPRMRVCDSMPDFGSAVAYCRVIYSCRKSAHRIWRACLDRCLEGCHLSCVIMFLWNR